MTPKLALWKLLEASKLCDRMKTNDQNMLKHSSPNTKIHFGLEQHQSINTEFSFVVELIP